MKSSDVVIDADANHVPLADEAPLRNPTGTGPLPDDLLCDAVCEMLDGGIGVYLRLYPARYTVQESLLPLLGGWKGDDEVTSDPEVAASWWTQHPGVMVACRCDCLVVFDVDLLPGDDGPRTEPNPWLDTLTPAQREAMKEGIVAITASGAHHYIFRQPDDRAIGSSSPAPGIDVKAGRGASVILPPSYVRKFAKGYEGRHHWLDDCYDYEAPPVLPAALVDLFDGLAQGRGSGRKRRNSLACTDERVLQGNRHAFLRNRAWHLRGQGLERSELVAAILAANQSRCDPPLPESEARGLAESAFEKKAPDADADSCAPDSTSAGKPQIMTTDRQLRDIIGEAWKVLLLRNDPPMLFNFAGKLARVVPDGTGLMIQPLGQAGAYGELIRAADWMVRRRGKTCDGKPPKDVADDLIVNPHPELPLLDAVVTTPVYDAGWRLLDTPGYHPGARLWLHLDDDPAACAIPDRPTEVDLAEASKLLLDDLLVDFPFADESDRAHAVAAFLLPFARRMFGGPTPIHLIEAPTPGAGKSLLADLIAIVGMGGVAGSTTVSRDESETRKKLTALLCRGRAIISIDNIDGGLWSSEISSAITAEWWDDRILGRTEMITLPNRALWLVSGNNPGLSQEVARRCVRIRLDPGVERPWMRTGFKHPAIRDWARQNRPALVRAVLTIIRSWITAGQPRGERELGSFELWSQHIGGMVGHLGLTGFLENATELYEAADSETGEWGALVAAWWARYGEAPVGVRELFELATTNDLVGFACAGASEQARKSKLGKALNSLRDRRFGDFEVEITKNSNTKARQYRLRSGFGLLFPAGSDL